jgi:hypothetical protein
LDSASRTGAIACTADNALGLCNLAPVQLRVSLTMPLDSASRTGAIACIADNGLGRCNLAPVRLHPLLTMPLDPAISHRCNCVYRRQCP